MSAANKASADRFVQEMMLHTDYLLRRAWGLTYQRVDAEDLLQETFVKAYLSFGTFREGSNLKWWLSRIMVNAWVDRYRTAQRRPAEQLSADFPDYELRGRPGDPQRALQSAEAQALENTPGRACMALRKLPRDLQVTIYYAFIEGYPNTEIAEMLGIPVGTVASRLHRGRSRLRELLAAS
ncbi:sigma-70 family RNA polymerase sigma factor [Mycolicibacterium sp.]|uniref:sigma-70 family RNA polymerase sigma factor n=1 Tax=Mycolicibacterium sp. TaxID=2320850 RepID=UPI003D101C2B